jgi:3',5'-nucleoside bisphosphate phosphatase
VNSWSADLHIHTALSPCAADDMTPCAIVRTARERGLAMIAICDHNTAQNVAAVRQAALQAPAPHATGAPPAPLTVIPGMEITTAEEVHVVGLFPTVDAALLVGAEVRSRLPMAGDGYAAYFGEQTIMRCDDAVTGHEVKALATAVPLDVSAVVHLIKEHDGLAVAAHIDRRSFGVISQLGLFPHDAGFDAVEVSRHVTDDSPRLAEFEAIGLPVLASSDSHYLADVGAARSVLHADEPTFAELAAAVRGQKGRSVGRA